MAPRKKVTIEEDDAGYASYEDMLADDFLNLTIQTPYGKVARYRLKVPTVIEWLETELLVMDDPIPYTAPGPGNTKGPNPYDVSHRKKQAPIDAKRQRMHLAEALDGGGKMKLPGRTLQEMGDALEDANLAHFNILWSALKAAVERGQAHSDADGSMFRRLQLSLNPRQGDATLSPVAAGVADDESGLAAGASARGSEAAAAGEQAHSEADDEG